MIDEALEGVWQWSCDINVQQSRRLSWLSVDSAAATETDASSLLATARSTLMPRILHLFSLPPV